ncbi:hypothetical protein [Pyrococcus sp. ST04]|uniref:hypothetical protein n=1 Tax=Pyrococcus sp. ST04 TaxID=1183377 RepID=UPI0002605955|nr:hypothetical protein [Pyrococcus sp. ST04]AFK21766.1 hypothetical protein Py04_0161 [Pyrococcus sp. ST04]
MKVKLLIYGDKDKIKILREKLKGISSITSVNIGVDITKLVVDVYEMINSHVNLDEILESVFGELCENNVLCNVCDFSGVLEFVKVSVEKWNGERVVVVRPVVDGVLGECILYDLACELMLEDYIIEDYNGGSDAIVIFEDDVFPSSLNEVAEDIIKMLKSFG